MIDMIFDKEMVDEHIISHKGCYYIKCENCYYKSEYDNNISHSNHHKCKITGKHYHEYSEAQDIRIYEYVLNIKKLEKLKEILQ